MPEIVGEIEAGEMAIKHLYLPGTIIRDLCPNCGKLCLVDLEKFSLSYPIVNKTTEFGMYCGDGCEHEWSISILLSLKIEIKERENNGQLQ